MKTKHLFLALTLLATAAATRTQAQVVTPNPTPTIINTAPYHITASGFYQLGANLDYAATANFPNAIIYVEAPNVTLDLGGHYISGPAANLGTNLYGIYAYERANLVIQNGTISHCFVGAEIDGNNTSTTQNINQRLSNLLIKTCYTVGINLNGAAYSTVKDCHISFIGGTTHQGSVGYAYGVNVTGGGKANQIIGNTITDINAGSIQGVGVYGSSGILYVSGNTIDTVTGGSGNNSSFGILDPGVAAGNTINNCNAGINFDAAGKYLNNVTLNCATPYVGGTDAGGNH